MTEQNQNSLTLNTASATASALARNTLGLNSAAYSGTSVARSPVNRSSALTVSGRPSRLSKYGVSFQPPQDDAVYYPADVAQTTFFQKGRDFESTYTNHKYTNDEKQTLRTYESQDYLPSHSEVFKNWIKRQPSR